MGLIKAIIRKTPLYNIMTASRSYKSIAQSIAQWSEHDQQMFDFYAQFMEPGDVCFDIGAHLGNRVKIFRRLGATVIAVEPQPNCMKILQKVFRGGRGVILIAKAMGQSEGEREMFIADSSTISSLSPNWISAVKDSGRFSQNQWNKKLRVSVTTLDQLIARYGVPAFIKVDVEGYEYEVVRVLSQRVRVISLEFTPEYLDPIYNSIKYLAGLGDIGLNFSMGETMEMAMKDWVSGEELLETLEHIDRNSFGDVYVKFI